MSSTSGTPTNASATIAGAAGQDGAEGTLCRCGKAQVLCRQLIQLFLHAGSPAGLAGQVTEARIYHDGAWKRETGHYAGIEAREPTEAGAAVIGRIGASAAIQLEFSQAASASACSDAVTGAT